MFSICVRWTQTLLCETYVTHNVNVTLLLCNSNILVIVLHYYLSFTFLFYCQANQALAGGQAC